MFMLPADRSGRKSPGAIPSAYNTADSIIRFIRTRVGDYAKKPLDGMGMAGCDHCIIDHCSISWSLDEGHSSRGAKNITFSRNLISEALNHSYHYGRHSFAASISGGIGSYHHNLLAHCAGRNWSLAGGLTRRQLRRLRYRNNIVYNKPSNHRRRNAVQFCQ